MQGAADRQLWAIAQKRIAGREVNTLRYGANITMSGTTSKEDLDGGILLLLNYLQNIKKTPVGKKTEENCRTFLYDVARKNPPLFPLNRRINDLSVERAIAQYKFNKKDKQKIRNIRRPTMKALGSDQWKEMVHIKF
jgi:hypothetical protein